MLSKNIKSEFGSKNRAEAEFQWKTPFTNTLPDIPSEPKFLSVIGTRHLRRFVDYNTQKRECSRGIFDFGPDLGTKIEIVDTDFYDVDPKRPPVIHSKDAYLLEEEHDRSSARRRADMRKKTEPLVKKTPLAAPAYRRRIPERLETKIGYGLVKKGEMSEEKLYRNRDEQIAAIEKTFEDVKKPAGKHYSKKGVYAVEECELLPDFQNYQYNFTQVVFDKDPAPLSLHEALRKLSLESGHITDMHGILGHFLPTEETLQRLLAEEDEDESKLDTSIPLEYVLNRDYNGVQQSADENFYIRRDGDSYCYNLLNNQKVVLSRIRRHAGDKMPTFKLELTRRRVTEEECKERMKRIEQLVFKYAQAEDDGFDEFDADNKNESDFGFSDGEPPVRAETPVHSLVDNEYGSSDDGHSSDSSSSSDSSAGTARLRAGRELSGVTVKEEIQDPGYAEQDSGYFPNAGETKDTPGDTSFDPSKVKPEPADDY